MALASLITSLAAVNSSTSIISSAMTGIQSGIGKIGEFLGEMWQKVTKLATDAWEKIKEVYDEHLAPIFDPLLEIGSRVFNILRDIWNNFMTNMKEGIDSLPERWENFKTRTEENIGNLRDKIMGIPNTIREKLGNIIETIFEKVGVIREKLGNLVETISTKLGGIRDKFTELRNDIRDKLVPVIDTLKAPFEYIWDLIGKIKDWLVSGVGDLIDWITPGGKDTTAAAAGTTVEGGVTQNFTIHIDVGGVTDQTDKRNLAIEISGMIQEEVARSLGGTTSRPVYTGY
jgi:phage-related protein